MIVASKEQPVSKGFAIGLQIWLLFLLSLYALGYPALFSIALGAIGGVASGFIVDWWLSKEERTEPEKKPQENEGVEEVAKDRKRRRPNSALQRRRQRREREPLNFSRLSRTIFGRSEKQDEER